MAEIKLRYNATTEEVELVVDGTVAESTGPDVFKSWVDSYNTAHPADPVTVEVVKEVLVERIPEKTVDVTPPSVVESTPPEVVAEVAEVDPPSDAKE